MDYVENAQKGNPLKYILGVLVSLAIITVVGFVAFSFMGVFIKLIPAIVLGLLAILLVITIVFLIVKMFFFIIGFGISIAAILLGIGLLIKLFN